MSPVSRSRLVQFAQDYIINDTSAVDDDKRLHRGSGQNFELPRNISSYYIAQFN